MTLICGRRNCSIFMGIHRRHHLSSKLSIRVCSAASRAYAKAPSIGKDCPSIDWPHPIYASAPLTDRKSTFLAYSTSLSCASSLPHFLIGLTLSSPRLKRATHRMYAFRSSSTAGQDDDGENGSGDRLARLLELSGCHDVVVVVYRWYGGVKLGSHRWRRISDVAKEALAAGCFMERQAESTRKNK